MKKILIMLLLLTAIPIALTAGPYTFWDDAGETYIQIMLGGSKSAVEVPFVPLVTVKVALGDTFKMNVISNPTTGYTWKIYTKMGDGEVRLLQDSFIAPDSNLMGAPGVHTWSFKAVKTGTVTLFMINSRDWEKDDPTAQKFRLKIIITER